VSPASFPRPSSSRPISSATSADKARRGAKGPPRSSSGSPHADTDGHGPFRIHSAFEVS
jgi:hypothetical protein